MKRPFYLLLLLSFLFTSCFSNGGDSDGDGIIGNFVDNLSGHSEDKCMSEFNLLVNSINSLPEAISKTEHFINEWASSGFYQVDDAKRIKSDLMDIKEFMMRDCSLSEFRSAVINESNKYKYSDYPIIQHAWNNASSEKDNQLAHAMLNSFNQYEFRKAMSESLEQIIRDNSKKLFGWDIDYIDTIEISEPEEISGRWEKTCNATFRVHLTGAVAGILKTTTKIHVVQNMGITPSGYTTTRLVDYSVLENSF